MQAQWVVNTGFCWILMDCAGAGFDLLAFGLINNDFRGGLCNYFSIYFQLFDFKINFICIVSCLCNVWIKKAIKCYVELIG